MSLRWLITLMLLGGTAAAQSDAGRSEKPRHVLLLIEASREAWRVAEAKVVMTALPIRRGKPAATAFRYELRAEDGSVLHSDAMVDPFVLRGEFRAGEGEAMESHHIQRQQTHFTVRVPWRAGAHHLRWLAQQGESWREVGRVTMPEVAR